MGRINRANLKKTIYYMKRNGIRRTWYAVLERLEERKLSPYVWMPPTDAELQAQRVRWEREGLSATFSVIVPAYRTKTEYLMELVESLRGQTYPRWELILADATEDASVEQVLRRILETRIRYVRLERNAGIAENTNQALPYATGDYVGLLDHDDILTPDALYEMAATIRRPLEMPSRLHRGEPGEQAPCLRGRAQGGAGFRGLAGLGGGSGGHSPCGLLRSAVRG